MDLMRKSYKLSLARKRKLHKMDREDLAHFLLRFITGTFFILFGSMKFVGLLTPPIDKIIVAIPLEISVFLMGVLETVLGIMLVLGIFTRASAWIGAVLMVVIIGSGTSLGLFWQLYLIKDIPFLIILIVLGITEPGVLSIDSWMQGKKLHKIKRRISKIQKKSKEEEEAPTEETA